MRSVCLVSLAVITSLNISTVQASNTKNSINCNKEALSDSVKKTGLQLQNMKQVYKIALQKQLKTLKKQKGWSKEEFLQNASTLMENDQVKAYNLKNRDILSSIATLNKDTRSKTPDCEMLQSLNNHLEDVVQNTREKWDFMFKEIKSAYSSDQK